MTASRANDDSAAAIADTDNDDGGTSGRVRAVLHALVRIAQRQVADGESEIVFDRMP
jgi:hypothetical protein